MRTIHENLIDNENEAGTASAVVVEQLPLQVREGELIAHQSIGNSLKSNLDSEFG